MNDRRRESYIFAHEPVIGKQNRETRYQSLSNDWEVQAYYYKNNIESGREAFSDRINPYSGRRVENEMSKTDLFCEENLWPRYGAEIKLAAFYASICYAARLL